MVFNNSSTVSPQFNNLGGSLASIGSRNVSSFAPQNLALNATMIDRIHKAKPGCSACGKKVA